MTSKSKYTWDETKNKSNHVKHGVSFEEIEEFDWENADVICDERHKEEDRYIAIGSIGDRLFVLVFTDRPPDTRIISLRKANKREFKRWQNG